MRYKASKLTAECVAALLLLALLLLAGCKENKPPPTAPPEVQVITVTPREVPIFQEWIGTLEGYVNAQIRAQVTGYLLQQAYKEGSDVKQGDLLFQIDPRPFQAALEQAQAKLAQDKAQLEKTRLDVGRYTPLAKDKAISQQDLDNAVQSNRAAEAQVNVDQAAIDTAALNLGFTRITAPVNGIAGMAQVQIGDLVGASSGVITTLSTLDPIRVYFQVNEQSYLTFWRQLAASTSATNQPGLQLQLILSDGAQYPHPGRFFFADRQVNPTTGTLQIAGLFPNPDLLLRPGQYALVRAQIGIETNAILLPQRAVTELQGSYQVAVVGATNSVHLQPVKVGRQINPDWIIDSGLKPGDRVVVEGIQKVREGTVVNPVPFARPTP